jgi:hypothetical protein
MQLASDLPPPPGALGADSLGLADEVPGDRARLLWGGLPPLENWVDSCGGSGALAGACGAGVASVAGASVEGAIATGGAGGPLDKMLVVPGVTAVAGVDGRVDGVVGGAWRLSRTVA